MFSDGRRLPVRTHLPAGLGGTRYARARTHLPVRRDSNELAEESTSR
jgi:hypothetical protein